MPGPVLCTRTKGEKVQPTQSKDAFRFGRSRRWHWAFDRSNEPSVRFPIQAVYIDWDKLIAQRPAVLETIDAMPAYLFKPEVLALLQAEKHPTYRLIMDLMWSTGATVSEVLALRPDSFREYGNDIVVVLKPLRHKAGRPSKVALRRFPEHHVPMMDLILLDRIESYLHGGRFRDNECIFKMARQTVNRHIHALIKREGGAPFPISCQTFRHSFAIHLILHGRPLTYVSQLLGLRSTATVKIYTNVLTITGTNLLEGVKFH